MSLFTREPRLLAVGAGGAACLDGRALPARVAPFDAALPSAAVLRELLGAGRGAVEVVIGDELARYFVLAAPEGCESLAELKGVAALRLQDLHAVEPAAWQISADWRARGDFLCCALPQAVLDAVREATAGRTLRSLAPAFVRLLDGAFLGGGRDGWVAARINGRATAAWREHGRCRLVRSSTVCAAALGPWVDTLATVSGRTAGVPQLIDADAPGPQRADLRLLAAAAGR